MHHLQDVPTKKVSQRSSNVGLLMQRARNYVTLIFSRLTGYGIEEEFVVEVGIKVVEQVVQRTCERVRCLIADSSQLPVILDEAQDRALIRYRVIHKVLPGI